MSSDHKSVNSEFLQAGNSNNAHDLPRCKHSAASTQSSENVKNEHKMKRRFEDSNITGEHAAMKLVENRAIDGRNIEINNFERRSEEKEIYDNRGIKFDNRTDTEILRKLPHTSTDHGNAQSLHQCGFENCIQVGTKDAQNMCAKHYCELSRENAFTQNGHDHRIPHDHQLELSEQNVPLSDSDSSDSGDIIEEHTDEDKKPTICKAPLCKNQPVREGFCENCYKLLTKIPQRADIDTENGHQKCVGCHGRRLRINGGLCYECYNYLSKYNSRSQSPIAPDNVQSAAIMQSPGTSQTAVTSQKRYDESDCCSPSRRVQRALSSDAQLENCTCKRLSRVQIPPHHATRDQNTRTHTSRDQIMPKSNSKSYSILDKMAPTERPLDMLQNGCLNEPTCACANTCNESRRRNHSVPRYNHQALHSPREQNHQVASNDIFPKDYELELIATTGSSTEMCLNRKCVNLGEMQLGGYCALCYRRMEPRRC